MSIERGKRRRDAEAETIAVLPAKASAEAIETQLMGIGVPEAEAKTHAAQLAPVLANMQDGYTLDFKRQPSSS